MIRQQNGQNRQSIKEFNQTLNVLLIFFAFPLFGFVNSKNLQIIKIDICHNTGSLTNPYEQISIASDEDLVVHQNHPGDIIPAPAEGCPGEIPIPTPMEVVPTETPEITFTLVSSGRTRPLCLVYSSQNNYVVVDYYNGKLEKLWVLNSNVVLGEVSDSEKLNNPCRPNP